jgi:signal transduction histidine kinase
MPAGLTGPPTWRASPAGGPSPRVGGSARHQPASAVAVPGLSLRTKVFFLFAGAVLLTVVPAFVLVARAVEDRVYERATDELMRAGEALAINWGLEDEVLLGDARLRALEPAVLQPLVEGDTLSLRRLLSHRLAEGRVIVAADSAGQRLVGPAPDSATLWASIGLGSIVTAPEDGSAPLRIAIWPVWSDGRPLGVVGVGTPLDTRVARRLDEALGTDVALIVDGVLSASTLPDGIAAELEQADLPMIVERGGTWKRMLASRWYLYRVQRLPVQGSTAAVLLFRPVGEELVIATGIRQSIVGIGVVALVLALILAGIVARIVARPAQLLAQAAAHLARGDYGAPLPPAAGDEIGQLTRVFGDMRSAIAEREARLRSAQTEMINREKLAAMGRLVAQLSHEINNPLYNIQNCLEALERRGDPADPNREFLELAQEELSRMAILTRQLLDQSRPLSRAAEPLDLNAIAGRVATLAAPRLEAHGIRVELELDPALPQVVVHPDGIQQVLANLVDNAIDAMVGGGLLRITTRSHAAMVELTVEDTGPGISEDELPHIFEAFYTTKPGVRGVGLGLFVSEGIIRGHRGRLTVESRTGEGSRFVVQLPRELLGPIVSDPEQASPAVAIPAATLARLVVEAAPPTTAHTRLTTREAGDP